MVVAVVVFLAGRTAYVCMSLLYRPTKNYVTGKKERLIRNCLLFYMLYAVAKLK